jgi:hypothetical protein
MLGTADFTASSGTTVVLANGATAGDLIRTESFFVSSVLNAIPAVANAVTETYINTGAVTPAKLSTGAPSWDGSGNLSFNSGYGSSAVAYGCRAWVNFNGTGTIAIRGSGNVSSVSNLGTGYYRINFSTAMPDVNYSVTGASSAESNFGGVLVVDTTTSYNSSGVNIYTIANNANATVDFISNSVSIFR